MTGQARWVGIVQAGYAPVQRETGLNDAEVAARGGRAVPAAGHHRRLPTSAGPGGRGLFVDQSDPFRFGLARSLDGVAAYLESAGGGHHDEPHPWTGLDDAVITEDRRLREAKKAVTAAEKTLRDAQARAALRPRGPGEAASHGPGLSPQPVAEGLSGRKWRQGPAVPRPAARRRPA